MDSSWARGRRAGARGVRARGVAGRAHLCRDPGLRRHQRRTPHDGAAARRLAGGASDAARAARCAPVAPHEIGYVNAHGSSTPLNDPTETLAIKQVFADHAYAMPVSGTKGYYGHALGASGAIEAAICALSLTHEWLPPTINLSAPDAACDLDYVPSTGRARARRCGALQLVRLRGINAALVMKRAD